MTLRCRKKKKPNKVVNRANLEHLFMPTQVESDIELPTEGVVDDNDEDMPFYPDTALEVTDDMIDQASEKRGAAMDAANEGMCQPIYGGVWPFKK